jgi:hypothetical protein
VQDATHQLFQHSSVPFSLSFRLRTDIFIHRSDPHSGPSCGPHHIARNFLTFCVVLSVTANKDHRPSFEVCSSRLLFCERARDAINLFPSPLLFISIIFYLLLLVRLRYCLLHFLWNLEIILLQKNSHQPGGSVVWISRAYRDSSTFHPLNFGSVFPSQSSSRPGTSYSFLESRTFRFVLTCAFHRGMLL